MIREGKIIGGLGTSIFLDNLSNILSGKLKLSDDMILCAISVENEVARHANVEKIFQENPDPPKSAVLETSPNRMALRDGFERLTILDPRLLKSDK